MSKIHTVLVLVLALAGLAGLVGCDEPASSTTRAAVEAPLPHLTVEPTQPASLTTQARSSQLDEPVVQAPPTVEETGPDLRTVDRVSLRRLVLSRGVEGREPIEAGNVFANEPRPLYAFLELENRTEAAQTVLVTFEAPDGTSVGHIALEVPAETPRWRTWGFSRMIAQPGAWTAIVLTEDGELLGRHDFDVRDES